MGHVGESFDDTQSSQKGLQVLDVIMQQILLFLRGKLHTKALTMTRKTMRTRTARIMILY